MRFPFARLAFLALFAFTSAGCAFFGRSKEELREIEAIKQRVLSQPGSVNEDRGDGTPLVYAVLNQYLDLAEWLVKHGADIDGPDRNQQTPLLTALISDRSKDLRITRFLLQHGAQVNTFGPGGQMPLHDAASLRRSDQALLLIEHGAKVTGRSFTGAMPLHIASEQAGNQAVALVLLEHGAKIEAHTFADETPLCRAALTGRADMAQFLIDHHADPSAPCNRGTTPLHFAALSGNSQVAKALIERGANVSARDYEGHTPLWLATHNQKRPRTESVAGEPNSWEVADLIRQHGGVE